MLMMFRTMKVEKSMKEIDKLYCISLVFALCLLAIPARGQQALDKTVQNNVELEREIGLLRKDSVNIKKEITNILTLIETDAKTSVELENKYESLVVATSQDSILKLRNIVALLETQRDSLQTSVAAIKKKVDEKNEKLRTTDSELQNMNVFSDIQVQQTYKDNLLYLNKKYSQMANVELENISNDQNKYQSFEGFSDYQKRIAAALKNKKLYDVAFNCINTGHGYKDVYKYRIDINVLLELKQDFPKKGLYKLTAEQFGELDSLDVKLSRLNNGIKALKAIVSRVNTDEYIKNIRSTKNTTAKTECIERMKKYVVPQEGSEEARIYERYFKTIPYLDKLLRMYWNELKRNPFSVGETEKAIKNLIVK